MMYEEEKEPELILLYPREKTLSLRTMGQEYEMPSLPGVEGQRIRIPGVNTEEPCFDMETPNSTHQSCHTSYQRRPSYVPRRRTIKPSDPPTATKQLKLPPTATAPPQQ
jgi:hypothetical protein